MSEVQSMIEGAQPPVTIAGAGHAFIAHDRIGPRVLEKLAAEYGPLVELCDIGTTALALLDHLRGQRLLLVVDACLFGGQPGEVRVVEPDLEAPPPTDSSVHQIGPMETLFVARHVSPELLPERIVLMLVETSTIDDSSEERACEEVVERIRAEVDALLATL